ncbi:hypothetical protein COCOBI_08-0780 [Coccomyxa sp. Obi]|nr:hypothetical protein COCOBI_08-0780 [Coccomyxa sp. Obi]
MLQVSAAFAAFSHHFAEDRRTYERVLRYPSGQVRRIRYPVVEEEESNERPQPDPTRSYAEGWDPEKWDNLGWDIVQPSGRVVRTDKSMQEVSSAPSVESPSEKVTALPSSPAELLRYIQSEPYKQAQRELQERVSTSYEVLEGSPWVMSRPVYVLASTQSDRNAGLTYTLRTRVTNLHAEDELSKVLGRRRADGSSVISVSEMRDGIVTFESEGDAQMFSAMLEADGHLEVAVMQADAHELFRASQSVRSVVVLLRSGCHMPQPDQLAAALRSKRSLEDSIDD